MKYYILLAFLFVCNSIQSQNYIKTLEENKTWKLYEDIGMGVSYYHKYHVSCDTTINGLQYYKLWRNSAIKGYLREDTLAEQIYFIDKDFTPELLIVDYSLNPGDTFTYTYINTLNNSSTSTIVDTVNYVDTILINQVPHKRIHFTPSSTGANFVFTEGSGNSFTGIAHPHPSLSFQTIVSEVYADTTITCSILSSIDQLENSPYQINLYPNPVQTLLHVDISTKIITDTYFLNITNVAGQVIESKNIASNTDEIDVSNLTKGVYFIHILNENRTIGVLKFIKQ